MSLTMTRPQVEIANTNPSPCCLASNDTLRAHNRFLMVNDLVRASDYYRVT